MVKLKIHTSSKREVLDITDRVEALLPNRSGVCNLTLLHTTAALTTADLDPGTDQDLLDVIEAISPKLKYRHPHNPAHAPDHIMSSLIGTSITLPVEKGKLILGQWQRVILIELDGPRDRNITLVLT